MKTYKAPWSTSVIVVSLLTAALLVGITISMVWKTRGPFSWMALLPVAIVCGGALFTIRGYAVTSEAILIYRLFWTTRLPLAGLVSAQSQPNAMRWSLRTFGNGGLFSVTGYFYNKALGAYRAFVTDPHRTVVLRFSRRTVVISPASPEDFVRDLGATSQPHH